MSHVEDFLKKHWKAIAGAGALGVAAIALIQFFKNPLGALGGAVNFTGNIVAPAYVAGSPAARNISTAAQDIGLSKEQANQFAAAQNFLQFLSPFGAIANLAEQNVSIPKEHVQAQSAALNILQTGLNPIGAVGSDLAQFLGL